jgi:hypothetical protein
MRHARRHAARAQDHLRRFALRGLPSRRMAKTSSLQKARLDPCPFLESCFINRVERINECLCAGITAWSPRDIFNAGSSAVYFVGDPEAVASNAKIYPDDAGLSALILSGWPLIEEARNVEAWRQGGDRPGRRAARAGVLVVGGFCCWCRCCC